MATIQCPKCSESIQESAKKCKHCQADLRSWFVRHPILTGVFGFVAFVCVVGLFNTTTSPSVVGNTTTVPETSSISCYDFEETFGLNSDLTDLQKDEEFKQYKGKYVQWTGTVAAISSTFGTSLQVKCHPNVLVSNVIVSFSNERVPQLLSYSEGDTITFTGKLLSWSSLLAHSLKDGKVVE
jgi:hypothetical protein